jgi:branched-subunit amino acid transport protein
MAMSYKSRRRWSLFVLLVALPVYIIAMIFVISLFERPPFWVELLIYVGSGVIWAFPLKSVFKGVGQADPDAPRDPLA